MLFFSPLSFLPCLLQDGHFSPFDYCHCYFFFPYLYISPDQSSEILSGYAQQCVLGRKLQIHAVTYDCSHPASLVSSCVDTYFLQSLVICFLFTCNVFSHKHVGKLTYSLKSSSSRAVFSLEQICTPEKKLFGALILVHTKARSDNQVMLTGLAAEGEQLFPDNHPVC